jgi:DNA-binding MarR family transcriptional regulator
VATVEGRTRFDESAPGYLDQIEHRFAEGLSDDELETIADALGRVTRRARATGRSSA